MSRPSEQLVALMRALKGDIMLLGVAGKMGISLARLAVRALQAAGVKKQVFGVSRFTDPPARAALEDVGVATIACDLLEPAQLAMLPLVENIIYMAGRKFGTEGQEELTWAMNTLAPAQVCRQCRDSRIVAFSSGNIYPLVPINSPGCKETEAPNPVGEYAQSCLARERIFQYFSRIHGNPVCLLRLNYAIDLRYGVLHDIAQTVWAEQPVPLMVPFFNCIWQGDANAQALLALEHCASPARVLNITGPEIVSVREMALEFGRLMGRKVMFSGEAGTQAFLNDSSLATNLFGPPTIPLAQLIPWTADWVMAGRRSLGKPTHFEVNTGKY